MSFGNIKHLLNIFYILEVNRCFLCVRRSILLLEESLSESGTSTICYFIIDTLLIASLLVIYKFPELLQQLYFILGQLENSIVKKTRRRYNMTTMILSLNVNLFKLLGKNKELLSHVPHPTDSKRSLFLLFDFVHIIQCFRNNCLNQKDFNCTFLFPRYCQF